MNEWIDVHSSLSILIVVNTCSGVKQPVSIIRKCGTFSYQESVYIYEGTSTTTNPIYSMSGCEEVTRQICVTTDITYTAVLKDSWGNGWSTGSSLTIVYKGTNKEYYLSDGSSKSVSIVFK